MIKCAGPLHSACQYGRGVLIACMFPVRCRWRELPPRERAGRDHGGSSRHEGRAPPWYLVCSRDLHAHFTARTPLLPCTRWPTFQPTLKRCMHGAAYAGSYSTAAARPARAAAPICLSTPARPHCCRAFRSGSSRGCGTARRLAARSSPSFMQSTRPTTPPPRPPQSNKA